MSEPTMTGITIEQAKDGQSVLYWPSTLGRGYRGVIRGKPFKCGETDVVHLRDMESEYTEVVCSGNNYVHAAALSNMTLVEDGPTIEEVEAAIGRSLETGVEAHLSTEELTEMVCIMLKDGRWDTVAIRYYREYIRRKREGKE